MDEPTVFIIDDDVNTRLSIGALVQSMNVRTECFESAELFLAADLLNRPGCVVTDLRMLGLSGLDLLEILAGSETALQIVVITAYASIPDAVRAVQCGAISFLEKSCQERELWQAINVALSKNNTLRLATQQKELDNSALASLTADEQIVLKLIAKGQSNKQVAIGLDIGLRTVEDRRRRIFRKLDVSSFAELMRMVVKAEQETKTA